MGELKSRVRVYRIDYICDEDGCEGFVLPTGLVLDSYPPFYEHECKLCGKGYSFHNIRYPRTIHEPKKE